MQKYVIDGFLLKGNISGVVRYEYEIVRELDNMAHNLDLELAIPEDCFNIINLKNINVIKLRGNTRSKFRTSFQLYILKSKRRFICLNNSMYLKRGGVICLHDIREYATNFKYVNFSFISKLKTKIKHRLIKCFAHDILTVSEFSKNEIIKKMGINESKIKVIYSAWQHTKRILPDEEIFNNHKYIDKKDYYFALGTIAKHKNIKWIIETAKNNSENQFIISGGENKVFGYDLIDKNISNLHYLGYLSDEEIAALMTYCKAFIFPSLYEGFGLPPLEALSYNAKVIVSKETCLPEIYGNSVHYIDPYDYNVDLDKLLNEPIASAKDVLEKYSWEKSAKELYKLLLKIK